RDIDNVDKLAGRIITQEFCDRHDVRQLCTDRQIPFRNGLVEHRIAQATLAQGLPATEAPSARWIVCPSLWSVSSIPQLRLTLDRAGAADFLLQEHYAVKEPLRGRRAARHVDIDGDNALATAHHGIRIVIVAPTVRARAH